MTTTSGTEPHLLYLAGRWVDSPDRLRVENPARPDEPPGWAYNATPDQYDQAEVRQREPKRQPEARQDRT